MHKLTVFYKLNLWSGLLFSLMLMLLSLSIPALGAELPSPNTGTIGTISSGDSLLDNGHSTDSGLSGKVTNNSGVITNNNIGSIVTNNNGMVTNNKGSVYFNHRSGTVSNNLLGGEVLGNDGEVSSNSGLVTDNYHIITNNNNAGMVANNRYGGTVVNNNYGGVVTLNSGEVTNNNMGSIVTSNNGMVTNNAGKVNVNSGTLTNNNLGGVVTLNNGVVVNNTYGSEVNNNVGTVSINSLGGTVRNNNDGGMVTENNGTVTCNSGIVTTNNSSGTVITNNGTVNYNYGIITDHRGRLTNNYKGGVVEIAAGQNGLVDNNGGTLRVDGVLSSSGISFINSGRLQGTGQVNTDVNNQGIIAPGNFIGNLTLQSLTMSADSILEIETGPGSSQNDKLIVTGAVVLNGSLHHTVLNRIYQPGQSWVVVESGSLSGQFSRVYSDFAFLTPNVSYINQQVLLTLNRNKISFDSYADSENQHSIARVLNGLISGELNNALLSLPDNRMVIQKAMDSLTGEAYASLPSLLLEDNQRLGQQLLGRLSVLAGNGVIDKAESLPAHGAWVAVNDNYSKNQGNNNYASASLSGPELLLGYEYGFGADWMGGAFFRYADRNFKVKDRGAKADVDSLSLGLYGSKGLDAASGNLRLSFGGNYTWHKVSMNREVSFINFNETNNSDYHASSAQFFGEMAYYLHLAEKMRMEPYINLSWNYMSSEDFIENSRASALKADIHSSDNLSSVLGIRFAYVPSQWLNLQANLGWQHTFGNLDMRGIFALQAGSNDFFVTGTPLSRNAALFGVGLEVSFNPQWSLGLQYDGIWGNNSIAHAGMASLTFRW